jgi:hypothetical protein
MGLATLFAVPAVGKVGFERWVRLSLIANALVTPLISVVYFYPTYSTRLLFLGFPWAITAPLFTLMVAIMLRRRQTADGARATISRHAGEDPIALHPPG